MGDLKIKAIKFMNSDEQIESPESFSEMQVEAEKLSEGIPGAEEKIARTEAKLALTKSQLDPNDKQQQILQSLENDLQGLKARLDERKARKKRLVQ